jgi:lytic cellulose monooxygenase (C1-hydroxylating)
MNDNCGKVTFTIPSCLAPGDYLIRAEVIALHVAGSAGGAQHYASCAQVTLSGGGNTVPSGVRFPGAYSTVRSEDVTLRRLLNHRT